MANRRIAHAVRTALMTAGAVGAAGAGLYVPTLAAQEALDEIVVTGSRIARRDAIAESPIFTVDQDTMRVSGFVTVEQYLNTLPQVVPNLSSQSNNPSSNGRAFIDLRGLGTNRNLVLIDGRRGMGSTSGGVVDVNTIPAALIERVEVISGGAAATYGPDAISGVVNFIMRKSFDGVAIDGQYRITEEGDGEEWGTDITFGSDFAGGRGSAVFNAGYFKRQAMYKGARSFSAQASSVSGTGPGGNWSTGTNLPSQAAIDDLFGAGLCNQTGGSTGWQFNPDGSLFCSGVQGNANLNMQGYTGPDAWLATNFTPDFFSYNFEPDNILVLPLERWNMFSRIEVDVNDNFKPYAQFQFTNYNALQELAATPTGGATGFSIPITNPFIPPSLAALAATRTKCNPALIDPDVPATSNRATCELVSGAADPIALGKRFVDLGGRTGFNTHDVWQTVVGATGDIVGSWRYDAYASWGRSVQLEAQNGNVNLDNARALISRADGGAGLCAGGLNLFGTPSISQECIDRISFEAKNLTTVEQGIVEAVVTGDLFELPAGTVQSAFGASYRNLDYDFRPDGGLVPGRVAGFNAALPTSGRLDFTDVFAEVVVPVVSDLPFIQSLSLTGGLRWTDNNIFGSEETWKVTADWVISDQVRFRGGMQHAVRAPNIGELFAPQVNSFPNFTNGDPCNATGAAGGKAARENDEFGRLGANGAQVAALCAAQSGIAGGADFSQPFGQANSLVGGNPNVDPETADSYTFGFVVAPQFDSPMFERLSFSIDYFNIELTDSIGGLGIFTIVQRCFNRDGANPTYSTDNLWCSLFSRNPDNGGVEFADQTQRNVSEIKIDGIDFTADWAIGAGPGDLAFQLVGSWLGKNETKTLITAFDPTYDFAGTIGNTTGSSSPEWKVNLTTSYTMAAWQFQLTNRYISSMVHAQTITGGAGDPVDSTWYTDLTARYDLTDNFTIRAGINNLSNQQPRLYNPNVQANTDPSLYDVLGRRFFLGFNWRM